MVFREKRERLTAGGDPREMRLISVNIGLPHDVTWHNKSDSSQVARRVSTSPLAGREKLALVTKSQ